MAVLELQDSLKLISRKTLSNIKMLKFPNSEMKKKKKEKIAVPLVNAADSIFLFKQLPQVVHLAHMPTIT